MFQKRIGKLQRAPTAVISQKPGRTSWRRWAEEVSKNRPTEGTNKTIVYLARMPRPTTSPAASHAQIVPRKIARWVRTAAQPQQQVYGASMVIRDEPAARTGSVNPRPTTATASPWRWHT